MRISIEELPQNIFDPEILQKVMDLKNKIESLRLAICRLSVVTILLKSGSSG